MTTTFTSWDCLGLTVTMRQRLKKPYQREKYNFGDNPKSKFYIFDIQVCRTTFCFLHGINHKRLESIRKNMVENGLEGRTHKLKRMPSNNAKPVESLKNVVKFIENFEIAALIAT